MKKVILFLVIASCACVVGLFLMAPEPTKANAAVSVSVPAVPVLDTAPVTLETSAVLVIVPEKKAAPKPRPVAARPKAKGTWQCGDWEDLQSSTGQVKRCEVR